MSNYPQEQRYKAYRYAADKPEEIDRAAPNTDAQRFEYREPREHPKGSNESDLCAQWKAANAASDSAFWAKWSFWVSIGGMFGLLATLYYTRKAVRAAEEATKDADAARPHPDGLDGKTIVPLGNIAPGQEKPRPGYALSGLRQGLRDVMNGAHSIFLEGQIRYWDAFGDEYYTNFQLAMTGSNMLKEPPSVTPHWNQAT